MEATAQGSRGPTISDGIEPDVSNSTISTDEPRSPSSNEFLTDNVDDPPGPTDDSEQPKNRTFSDPSLSTSKLLDVEGYENEEIQKLSQAIDRFRELKLEKHVALPQLVVAGNQSSGKSSLLESLTGVPFPKGYGLCTRYATEITLRGAPNESIEFSVTTTTSTPSDRKDRINKFGKQVRAKSDVGTFQSLLTELDWVFWGAHSRSDENLAARGFAQEMLKIEISGPQLKPLKFIDTPGLFSSESLKQTKDDAKTVNTLVENLIHPDRTIIVAVMDCRGNPETQSIFRLAANADPERHRTIGVLTKCDLLLESGEIAQVVKVAQNQVMQLSRGWFAVNNRSEKDLKDQLSLSQTRRNEEKFFCNSEWSGINNIERTGIQRLKAFLGERFCHHLRDEFPKILDEIKLKLAKAEEERDALGPPRATEGEQREYLLRVAETFERTIDRSIADHVSSSPEDCPSRLWPQLRQLADTFTNDMRQNGHLRVFDSKIGEPTERSLRNAGRPIHGYCHGQGNETDESETETDENLTEYARTPEIEANLQEGEEGSMDEVPPIRFDSNIRPRNIYTWINRNYHTSMGRGIACPANYDLLESLFRDQSGPWRRIAFKYLKAAENVLITLIDFALSKSQSDESITKRISALLKSEAERCFKEARIRLREILRAERCFMQTTDESFLKALSKARTLRATEALKRIASQTGTGLLSISLQSLDDIGNTENQTRNHVYDTHDYLREYYKLSLRRFVDSVSVYVVNGYLLSPSGPLRILNREYVCSLYPHQLNAIAGEDFKTLSRRQILKETIDGLSNALTITDQTLGPMYFSMPKPPQVNGENTRTGPSKSIKSVASGPGPSSSAISLFKSQVETQPTNMLSVNGSMKRSSSPRTGSTSFSFGQLQPNEREKHSAKSTGSSILGDAAKQTTIQSTPKKRSPRVRLPPPSPNSSSLSGDGLTEGGTNISPVPASEGSPGARKLRAVDASKPLPTSGSSGNESASYASREHAKSGSTTSSGSPQGIFGPRSSDPPKAASTKSTIPLRGGFPSTWEAPAASSPKSTSTTTPQAKPVPFSFGAPIENSSSHPPPPSWPFESLKR